MSAMRESMLVPPPRRPFHVLYGGAHRFTRETSVKLGHLARRALSEYAPGPAELVDLIGLPLEETSPVAARVYARLCVKLEREPIEDLRVDFEDGLGPRSDDEEDIEADRAGHELAAAAEARELPRFVGLRIKALRGASAPRAKRTLERFCRASATALAALPSLAVTLPKVEGPDEVAALAEALEALEHELGLAPGFFEVEVMIEGARGLVSSDGRLLPRALVDAGAGRVRSVHLGTYDLLSALDVTAPHQRPDHPLADEARRWLKLALAGSDATLSDGACHLMPIAPHRAANGAALGDGQHRENREAVARALRVHAAAIHRALELGIYSGWDLHPTQLLARWAVVFAFFLEDLDAQTARLFAWLARARAAERTGAMFDDAASAQGLVHTFVRGYQAGALDDDDLERAGLDPRALGGFAPR